MSQGGDSSVAVQQGRFDQAMSELKADGLIDGDFNPGFSPGHAVGFEDGSISEGLISQQAQDVASGFEGASEIGGVTQPPPLLRTLGIRLFLRSTIFGGVTNGGFDFETSAGLVTVRSPIMSTKFAILHEFAHHTLGIRNEARAGDFARGKLGL